MAGLSDKVEQLSAELNRALGERSRALARAEGLERELLELGSRLVQAEAVASRVVEAQRKAEILGEELMRARSETVDLVRRVEELETELAACVARRQELEEQSAQQVLRPKGPRSLPFRGRAARRGRSEQTD